MTHSCINALRFGLSNVPLLPVMTGTFRGRERQSKTMGFCTHGMRKWVPSPTTVSCTPRNLSNITAWCPASTVTGRQIEVNQLKKIVFWRAISCYKKKKKINKFISVRDISSFNCLPVSFHISFCATSFITSFGGAEKLPPRSLKTNWRKLRCPLQRGLWLTAGTQAASWSRFCRSSTLHII